MRFIHGKVCTYYAQEQDSAPTQRSNNIYQSCSLGSTFDQTVFSSMVQVWSIAREKSFQNSRTLSKNLNISSKIQKISRNLEISKIFTESSKLQRILKIFQNLKMAHFIWSLDGREAFNVDLFNSNLLFRMEIGPSSTPKSNSSTVRSTRGQPLIPPAKIQNSYQ